MQSFQNIAVKTGLKLLRQNLFLEKTENNTIRVNFERISNISKFPRFVKMEETTYVNLDAAWFYPDNMVKNKVILYLHGGGYCFGSYHSHRSLIARIARACDCKTLAVNYRKAPEYPYPAALEDAIKVYEHLLYEGYENIFVMGDSAGGGLTLALTIKAKEMGWKLPAALVCLSPWTDLTLGGESITTKADIDPMITPFLLERYTSRYCQNNDPKDKFISPLFGDFTGFPPTYIQVGANEVLFDDSTRLAKKMLNDGVKTKLDVYKNMMHVFQWLGGLLPEANKAIDEIGSFVRAIKIAKKTKKTDNVAMEIY